MYTTTRCPHCQSTFQVEREHLGQEAECLECDQVFKLWDASGSVVEPADGDGVGPALLPEPFGFSSVLALTFSTVFGRAWGQLVLAILVYIGASIAVSIGSAIIQGVLGANTVSGVVVDLGYSLATQVLLISPLMFGLWVLAAQACRGRAVEVGQMFIAFQRYADVVVLSLIQIAIVIGVLIAAMVFAAPGLVMLTMSQGQGTAAWVVLSLGVLLGVLLTAYTMVRLTMAPFLLLDPEGAHITPADALRESWRMMRGRVFVTICAFVLVLIVAVLSFLLLCVGYILIGMPLLFTLYGAVYALASSDEMKRHGQGAIEQDGGDGLAGSPAV